jgi:hypothetical protein
MKVSSPGLRFARLSLVVSSLVVAPFVAAPFVAAPFVVAPSAQSAPYELDKRPMPKGQDLETLLPRKVGTFTREAFPAGTKPSDSEDLNIDYKSGAEVINVGFSIPGAKDAHEGIRIAKAETIAELKRLRRAKEITTAQEQIGPPTSYYKVADFIAWTRGGYFFYAKAKNAAALDAFMTAFPY